MRISAVWSCLVVVLITSIASQAVAITVQTGADVFDGRSFLWVEAEDYSALAADPENDGWKIVSKETPINSVPYSDAATRPILPANSNVSGTALLDDIGGGSHTDEATYEVQFATPGAYQIYLRHTMFDRNANNAFGDEDSIYMSPAFNKNADSDWIGFQGKEFDDQDLTVDPPQPGEALDPDGFKPVTADSTNDGWYATRDWGIKSDGVVTFPNNSLDPNSPWNGHFNWYGRPVFVGATPAGGFNDDFSFKTEYIVTEEMVGQTLTFEVDTREPYVVVDGFLFIEDDDWNLLEVNSQADLDEGILSPAALDGDYNGDGKVDAADYVVWRAGGSPDDTQAGYNLWRTNFGLGTGAGASVGAIPEPASVGLLVLGLAALTVARRRSDR
jgi:PEP-CTERM motif